MEGMDTRAGSQVIKAKVPLGEMFGYVTLYVPLLPVEQHQLWSFRTMLKHQE